MVVIGLFVIAIQNTGSNVADEEPVQTNSEEAKESAVEDLPEFQSPEIVGRPDTLDNESQEQSTPELPQINEEQFPDKLLNPERVVFAQVFDEENAEWATPVDRQIGPGTYRLLKGNFGHPDG